MLMADIGTTLGVLNVPEDVIKDVMTMLEENADALEKRKPSPIKAAAFGGSTWASQLGFDASLAQEAASKEIIDMVAGLRRYSENIEKFAKDVTDTDQSNADTMAAFQAATDCVAAPTFAAPSSCSIPTEDEG